MVPLVDKDENGRPIDRGNVLLMGGWNEIVPADYKYCKETMQVGIESGKFELKGKKGEDDEVLECGLEDIRADIAKNVVRDCFNPVTLERWKDDPKLTSELRGTVEIQLQKIADVE